MHDDMYDDIFSFIRLTIPYLSLRHIYVFPAIQYHKKWNKNKRANRIIFYPSQKVPRVSDAEVEMIKKNSNLEKSFENKMLSKYKILYFFQKTA